jgi:hypothetical protein
MALMGGTALSSVLGGFLGSKSAKKSARAQQAAIQQAMALQREGMGKAEGLLQPGANYKPAMMRLRTCSASMAGSLSRMHMAHFVTRRDTGSIWNKAWERPIAVRLHMARLCQGAH